MHRSPLKRDEVAFLTPLLSPMGRAHFRKLQRLEPRLKRFDGWTDLLSFLRDSRGTDRELRDDILRSVLRARKEDASSLWLNAMFVLLWPGLLQAFGLRAHLDPEEPEELWQVMCHRFLGAIDRIDPEDEKGRIGVRLLGTVRSETCREYRRRRKGRVPTVERDAAVLDQSLEEVDLEDEREVVIRRLKRAVDRGLLKRSDFDLLCSTVIYGHCLDDYASACGIKYETAKKRRQRALAVLRPWGCRRLFS